MNTSPGLLANDVLEMSLQLESGAQLYLADQSATKVHTMPLPDAKAAVNYHIEIGDRATLEFLPEPLILFAEAALIQKTHITVHPTAGLSLGEIILPGRLARGEHYQFREFMSRIEVRSSEGKLLFAEAMKLKGKTNRFAQNALFSSGAVLGSLVLILPEAIASPHALTKLSTDIDKLTQDFPAVELASSVLPQNKGLFVRAMAANTRSLQACFRNALNSVRQVKNELPLPYSV